MGRRRTGRAIVTAIGVALFLVGGWALERWDRFQPLRNSVRGHSVASGILNFGSLGALVKQLSLVRAVPNESWSAADEAQRPDPPLFRRKRRESGIVYQVSPGGASGMPSSRAIGADDFEPGWPLLSIAIDEASLHDPETGLLANKRARGEEWEHLACVSYYEEGALRFATSAGLRNHGGAIRNDPDRHSFRLYFRNRHGADHVPPGVVFETGTVPIKRLVVRHDQPWPFLNSLAFDIVRRIGGAVPDSKQVLLFLNGEPRGIYLLTEHLSRRQWREHFGHDDFAFFRFKKKVMDGFSIDRFQRLERWIENPPVALSMDNVSPPVDLENFSRYWFASIYTGNNDSNQGVAALDTADPEARWFWINWDFDDAFRDKGYEGPHRETWQQAGMGLVLRSENATGMLFKRLWKTAEFRSYFVRLVMDLLNHSIPEHYLLDRIDHYERLAQAHAGFAAENRDSIALMRDFVRNRGLFVRRELGRRARVGPPHPVQVEGPEGLELRIDGRPAATGYRGWYFRDFPIAVEVVGAERERFSHWLVNGKSVGGRELVQRIESRTQIAPVLRRRS